MWMKWIFIIIGEIYESNMVRCKHKSCQKSRKKTGKGTKFIFHKNCVFFENIISKMCDVCISHSSFRKLEVCYDRLSFIVCGSTSTYSKTKSIQKKLQCIKING